MEASGVVVICVKWPFMESSAGFRDSLPNMKELDYTPMFHDSSGGREIVHREGWRWSCRDNTHLSRRVPAAISGTSRIIFHSVIDRSQFWKVWNPFAPHVGDSLWRKQRRACTCTRAHTNTRARARNEAQQKMCKDIFVSGDKTVLRDCEKWGEDRYRR